MAKKSKKISKEVVIIVLVLLLIAVATFAFCWFFVDGFKDRVASRFDEYFGENEPELNDPKGNDELRVHFIDVGQGDCIFIELPDDTVMLIDSGNRNNTTANRIISYIQGLGVSRIDYLMATHSDSDHTGNMAAVLGAFEVEVAYVPDIEDPTAISKTYADFYALLQSETFGESQKCEVRISSQLELIVSEKDDADFFIAFLAPTDAEDIYGAKKPSAHVLNAISPIMLIEYMNKRVVLTGDTVTECEEKLVDKYKNGFFDTGFAKKGGGYYSINLDNVDILKVAHHGGETSTCEKFVNLLQPKYAVISVGANNSYNHPREEVLERLAGIGAEILRTDLKGTIIATILPDPQAEITFAFFTWENGKTTVAAVIWCDFDREKYLAIEYEII